MAIIKLDTVNRPQWRIVAETIDYPGGPPNHRKGNVDMSDIGAVTWSTDNSPGWILRYEVTFTDFASGNPTWPFAEDSSGANPAPQGYLGPLALPANSTVTLTARSGAPALVKYDVKVVPNAANPGKNADPLDPMIIIRPPVVSDSVALAVTCGVLGAIAGAAACALMS